MTKKPSSLTELKRLSRERASGEDLQAIMNQLYNDPNDRAVAILGATLLESELEQVLLSHMILLKDEEYNQIFVGHSPLASFSAKIQIGYALGYYKKNVFDALNVIKDIRNAFAHGKKSLSFRHEVVKRCCNLLTVFEDNEPCFEPSPDVKQNSSRHRYLNHVAMFITLFVEMSVEGMLDRAHEMGVGPTNYKPGDLRPTIKTE